MPRYILHLTTAVEWTNSQGLGEHHAPSLLTEGFIHCSTFNQVLATAERHFASAAHLLLLVLDTSLLKAPLKYEAARDELYPHVYGAINLGAVETTVELVRNSVGKFEFPAELERFSELA